ncbi:Rho GTPase [Helicostylum pulchrum]|uniref:Rho GTPase n=1 Tax=Helicostylum pulchrum TaxID=562976 RepID=A0ABP9XKT2_9FUNG
MKVDNRDIELALWDTAGQEDYDRLRPLSYPHSHVILLCFAIDSPDSLDNVQEKWVEELNTHAYGVPMILVGCKRDLRSDKKTIDELEKISQKPVSFEEGFAAASHIGAQKYVECSAKVDEGVTELFTIAARAAYMYSDNLMKARKKGKCICL